MIHKSNSSQLQKLGQPLWLAFSLGKIRFRTAPLSQHLIPGPTALERASSGRPFVL
jgi:hypothetical protein